MRPRILFFFWFTLTVLAIGAIQFSQARSMGGLGGLLGVGESHGVREVIEKQIPGVPLVSGIGHDGQLFYAIAVDPLGRFVPEAMEPDESPSYRYRRIGYPALSGLFSVLEGHSVIWAMALLNTLSAGVGAGSVALIARHLSLTPWLAIGVLMNPGVWLSARLLTADNLALAGGLLGILACLKGRPWLATIPLAFAVLTKEVAIVFALALAGHALASKRPQVALQLVLGALIPIGLWLAYVHSAIGDVLSTSGNLSWPFGGLIEASSVWPDQRLRDNIWIAVLATFIVLACVGFSRSRPLWRWLTWSWIAVALISSHLVWDVGNNAIRTLAPIITLTVLGLADRNATASDADDAWSVATPASP